MSEEFKAIKNPRERFKKLKNAWTNVSLEDLNRYNEMHYNDELRFRADAELYNTL